MTAKEILQNKMYLENYVQLKCQKIFVKDLGNPFTYMI